MQYNVYLVNIDESASLINVLADLASAEAFVSAQGPGTYRIELANPSEASIVAELVNS